jgi:hypothetical protein
MGAAQNPTEQLKGIDSRGDAALRQAIATGSPVPTTGEQAKELVRIELPKPDYTGLQQWFKQLAKAAGAK